MRTRNIPNRIERGPEEIKRRGQPVVIEFKVVKLAPLRIPDEVYQRPSSTRAVNRMVEEGWDDGLQSVLLVSADTNNVLDGAHRVRAARRLGITQLPALVYHGLSVQDEARYFAEFNRKRLPVGLRTRHRAALVYGEPAHLEAQRIVEALSPKEAPLQTIMASNSRYPGILAVIVPILKEMDCQTFSRDFIAGISHFASLTNGRLSDEIANRLREPHFYRYAMECIKQVMREHMRAGNRAALPTDWSVRAEGVQLALTTRPAHAPRPLSPPSVQQIEPALPLETEHA